MKNLAGNKDCDKYIQKELEKAKIPVEQIEVRKTEVPYSFIGKLKDWTFTRAWHYWIAEAKGDGIPLQSALRMHNKPYPDDMFDHEQEYGNYGNSIRVGGHCGCPSPDEYMGRGGFVKSYHIDSQEGLNELVRVINSL